MIIVQHFLRTAFGTKRVPAESRPPGLGLAESPFEPLAHQVQGGALGGNHQVALLHGRAIAEQAPEPSVGGMTEAASAGQPPDHHFDVIRNGDEGVDVLKFESGHGGGFRVLWFALR